MSRKLTRNQTGATPITALRLPVEMRRRIAAIAQSRHVPFAVAVRMLLERALAGIGAVAVAREHMRESAPVEPKPVRRRVETEADESEEEALQRSEAAAGFAERAAARAIPEPKTDLSRSAQQRLIALALRSTQKQTEQKTADDRALKKKQRVQAVDLEMQAERRR